MKKDILAIQDDSMIVVSDTICVKIAFAGKQTMHI